jgi:hypothetical protein
VILAVIVAVLFAWYVAVRLYPSQNEPTKGNTFSAEILADSLSPAGYRLTTFLVTLPRFILAEFNTHRRISRNSASSRAIPIKRQIQRVIKYPFVPLGFGGAQKGMQAAEDLSGWRERVARQTWLKTRYAAVAAAWMLDRLGVHKSFANRVLEPWLWHTVIATATEWENFFALRTDAAAQPEFRHVAEMMELLYRDNKPKKLGPLEWHLPMLSAEDRKFLCPSVHSFVDAGRAARVSFDTHDRDEPIRASYARAEMLTSNGHWSPTEHQAKVGLSVESAAGHNGNLQGDWMQFRKMFDNEDNYALLKESTHVEA